MDATNTCHKPEPKHCHREGRPAAQNKVYNCSHAAFKKLRIYNEEKRIVSPLKDLSEQGSGDDNGYNGRDTHKGKQKQHVQSVMSANLEEG